MYSQSMSTDQLAEIQMKIAALPEGERDALFQEAMLHTQDMRWLPTPGPQMQAYFSEADELFYGGEAGGGKGLSKKEAVLTPFGWTTMEKLKVGSVLCATDGSVQKVLAVYHRGVQPMFKLSWSDGSETICDSDHIWLGWVTGRIKKKKGAMALGKEASRKWTTAELFDYYQKERKRKTRFAVSPMSAPCVFNVSEKRSSRIIHPYALGVLLGDGHLARCSFFSGDEALIERVELLEGPLMRKDKARGGIACFYSEKTLRPKLQKLNLYDKKSNNKFIPRAYLFGSVEDRWELLRGLMDTDGWVDADGDCYFCSVSSQLIHDVKHLARSLGAVVSEREKLPHYTYKGQRKQGQKAFTLRIKMPQPERMFTLKRKKDICKNKVNQSLAIYLDDIVPAEPEETICIIVSHENSLFVINNFIVTHNTDLICGLAVTAHEKSLLMKRLDKDKRMLYDRVGEILGNPTEGGNKQAGIWSFDKGKSVDLGGCETEDDKQNYKGRAHDLKAFDELPDFTKGQYQFIKTWNRSTTKGQRTRVVATGNPPTTAEGLWIIDYWRCWLDPRHPNPAKDGELRWFIEMDNGEDAEVPAPGLYFTYEMTPLPATQDDQLAWEKDKSKPKPVKASSRTFIRSRLSDNPFLASTDYAKVLDALPAEIRAAYRDGRFDLGLKDNPAQVIPTTWVAAAQARWTEKPLPGVPMCVIGVDVARGGEDSTTLACRYDAWYAPLISVPGSKTPFGTDVAGLVVTHRRDNATVVVDMGGGYGGAPYEHLRANNIDTVGFNGAEKSNRRTRDKRLRFANKRAEAWWQFREALDPSQEGGAEIALPKDQKLLAELTTPTFSVSPQGIRIESKDDVKKRIGRSTDHADAVIMAWSVGQHDISAAIMHGLPIAHRKARPKVVRGYGNLKR